MKNEIHIFLCFNPMPNIYLPTLIKELGIKEYKVIEFYSKPIITTIDKKYIKRFLHSNRLTYIRNIRLAVQYIEEMIKSYHKVTFYFTHIFNSIANYFFFQNNTSYNFIQIPEGIANYYNITTKSLIHTMILKKIIGLLIGVKFTLYFSHLTGIMEKRYNKIVAFYTNGLVHNNQEIIKLNIDRKFERITEDVKYRILILGQSYYNFNIYFSNYKQIFSYVNSAFGANYTVYYKFHPNEIIKMKFKELLRQHNISILDRKEQIEFFASEFGTIISEASSALFSIKVIYGDKINCVAIVKNKKYLSGRRMSKTHIKKIKEQLRRVDVRIIE